MSSTPERGIELLRTFCRRGMESREFGGWKESLGWEMVTGRVRVVGQSEERRHHQHLARGERAETPRSRGVLWSRSRVVFDPTVRREEVDGVDQGP